jgi:tetratricopeptide (TPR) repeat protein
MPLFVGSSRVNALLIVRSAALVFVAALGLVPASGQSGSGGGHPIPAPAPPPPAKLPNDSFDQKSLRYGTKEASEVRKPLEERTCFLPPLVGIHSSTVAISNVEPPSKAQKEYETGCDALKKNKLDVAETHLRKAVQLHPAFSAAWVTLGQMLSAKQQTDDARNACAQATVGDSSYVPAYLCLAEIAARTEQWQEVLKFSSRAMELDPTGNAVEYGYNAAANLRLRQLPAAETSALRAVQIDKNNSDPRLHFLLAQIYEAKGDAANEAAQLREYLKFATDPADIEMVKAYLAQLDKKVQK